MSKLFGIAAVSLGMAVPAPAKAMAHFATGNDLVRICADTEGAAPDCVAYLKGAADMVSATSDAVCLRNGTTSRQIWLVTWNFMKAHPQDMNRPAGLLSFAALIQAFPCQLDKRPASRRQDPTS